VVLSSNQDALRRIDNKQVAQITQISPDTIVEMFSYGCGYCEKSEKELDKFEKMLPASKKLIRMHVSNNGGLGRFAPLYATLNVMGLESKLRVAAFHAVIQERKDLAEPTIRNQWLIANGVDVAEYEKTEKSAQVKALLQLSKQLTEVYGVNGTPEYIVGKRWVTFTDREWPAMGKQLMSLLMNDKPLEK
ncbi:thiol:disulfide interchange protein DsbA/DsbL, partial [Salmonella enterica]|nr:thiol:disulfide interchange protein DsbA/DsbL [Salmonella enterica]ECH2879972.1 thiol:disulfide interchange protein DsbA/DsbL [Salmonella enterica]ECT4306863.1 thiol:disulfide interchange protein DsbA/DsbL [Salmonella enterica]EFU6863828.1 thiol:disulfide interchange protein DsbA/DsbL [Salmonella enterica]EIP4197727.1 thiol:disulfide interchange protein DsbA/DsbL [Salmonella enterica]